MKKNLFDTVALVLMVTGAGMLLTYVTQYNTVMLAGQVTQSSKTNETPAPKPQPTVAAVPLYEHKPLSFDLRGKLKGLSTDQIEEHEQLYRGYVAKRNEIAQQLVTADRSQANNVTNSVYRGLKTAETFALNGDILHRLYFQNLTPTKTNIGKQTLKLIERNFGSLEAYKEDLFAAAKSARGWAITAYALDDGRVYNFVLDTHNQMVPMLVIPLVVIDVYEHAYMIDFGIQRVPYLDVIWSSLDWNVIEKRVSFVERHAEAFAAYF